jgi:hypothetical protein
MCLILVILIVTPCFLEFCNNIDRIPPHLRISCSRFNVGITVRRVKSETLSGWEWYYGQKSEEWDIEWLRMVLRSEEWRVRHWVAENGITVRRVKSETLSGWEWYYGQKSEEWDIEWLRMGRDYKDAGGERNSQKPKTLALGDWINTDANKRHLFYLSLVSSDVCRFWWPCGLRHRFAADRLLG